MPPTDRERTLVSVVIPVKDDGGRLARCLEALSNQTRPADEIIVVDNASTDATASIARAGGARVVPCATPGIPAASSRGYDAATGDLVLRLDADCIPSALWIEAMVEAFADRPDVSVFSGGARFADGPRLLRAPLAALYLASYVLMVAPSLGHLPLFGSNLGFRRTAWLRIRSRAHRDDARLHDDLDLAFHFGERHRIRFLAGASMSMSMRPFRSVRSFAERIGPGVRTVLVHWPHDFPPVRWVRLLMRRALHALGVPTPRRARAARGA